MKQARFFLALCSFAVFVFYSCSKGGGTNNNGGNTGGGSGGTTAGPLFTAVKAVTSANCAVSGCHIGSVPTGGLDFSNDNVIVTQKSNIKSRAVDQAGTANQMPQPPRAPLSAADQKKITDWIAAGGRLTD